jgi:hypothetical protein
VKKQEENRLLCKRKKLKKNEGEIKKMFIPVLEDGDGIPKGYFVIKIHKGSRYEVERQLTALSLHYR